MNIAIIDIGTHAVRVAIYDGDKLGSKEIYTYNFRSDIDDLLLRDNMNIDHSVYSIFNHFKQIFKNFNVQSVHSIATEVLRNNPKASEFVDLIDKKYGIKISILTGEEEARIGAYGLISGIDDARGVLADFGGGSLEITQINNKDLGDLKSFPLGMQKLKENSNVTIASVKEQILSEFDDINVETLYFIGGSLRRIANLYLQYTKYPLQSLHQLTISTDSLMWYMQKLIDMSERNYSIANASKKGGSLFYTIIIARALIEIFSPKNIVISTYGIKEGVRFCNLTKEEKQKNLIHERLKICSGNYNIDSYISLFSPFLLPSNENLDQIIEFSIQIANIITSQKININNLSSYILNLDVPFSHPQRIMTSIVLNMLYNNKIDSLLYQSSKQILHKNDYNNSRIIGNLMKLCHEIDGPHFNQPSFKIELLDNFWKLVIDYSIPKTLFTNSCHILKSVISIKNLSNIDSYH